jgi:uncharacterized membrane protein (UPF0127 family)
MKKIWPALFVILLASVGVRSVVHNTDPKKAEKDTQITQSDSQTFQKIGVDTRTTLKIGQKLLKIDLANTPALRTLGLSGRGSLAPDHGMLFVFEKPDLHGFWMKEMNFSIDIIWIDASKKIVHIEERVSPESYPKIYIPDAQALFVLEVPAGFVTENKIRVGDEVKF